MPYKYKDEILEGIEMEPNANFDIESERYYQKLEELDHVYAQAAKADEYEAKAEAFDRIVKIAETSDNHLDFSDKVDSVIKNYQEDE